MDFAEDTSRLPGLLDVTGASPSISILSGPPDEAAFSLGLPFFKVKGGKGAMSQFFLKPLDWAQVAWFVYCGSKKSKLSKCKSYDWLLSKVSLQALG